MPVTLHHPTSWRDAALHFSTARSESAPTCAMKRSQARRIVSAVRNGLVGLSSEKQSQLRSRRCQLCERVLDPLDVRRPVAGKLRRSQNGTSAP
jgi:hypothetical protein